MEGDAVSLVCIDERDLLEEIERLLRGPIPWETVPGFEPDLRLRAEAIPELTRGGRSSGARSSGGRSRRSAPRRTPARPPARADGSRGHVTNGPRPATTHTTPHRPAAPQTAPVHTGAPRSFVALPGERFARSSAN